MSANTKETRSQRYTTPRISTLAAGDVLAALGPVAAGSQKSEEIKWP